MLVFKWKMAKELCVCSWLPCRIYVTSAAQEGDTRAFPAARRRQTYVAAKSRGQKSLFIEGQIERGGRGWLQFSHVTRATIHHLCVPYLQLSFHSLPQHIYRNTSFHCGCSPFEPSDFNLLFPLDCWMLSKSINRPPT